MQETRIFDFIYFIYKFSTDIHEIDINHTTVCNDNVTGKDKKVPLVEL